MDVYHIQYRMDKQCQPKFSAGKEATEQEYQVEFYFDDIAYPFYTGYGTHP